MLHEHFQDSLIVHNLIFILIGFAGVAIVAFSPPRGLKSKTLCIILCWILAGGGVVGMVTTSAGEIKWLEETIRVLEENMERESRVARYRQKHIGEMNENAQRVLGQLVAQGCSGSVILRHPDPTGR